MTQRIALLLALIIFPGSLFARAPDQAEFYAATDLGKAIASWIGELSPPPKSVAIFSVYSNEPFDQDYSVLLESEIIKQLHGKGLEHVSSCSECRAPQIVLDGENLVVRKGLPDAETLKKIGERHPVEAFITIDVYRSSFEVLANVTAYSNPEAQVISSERFSAPALSLATADVQFLVTGGTGKPLSTTVDGYSLAGNLMLVEEMGFAKGGLQIGAILAGAAGTLIYTLPTIAFRGGFGNMNLNWSLNLGAGFGLQGGQKGICLRSGFEVFLGSFTVIGVDGAYFMPDASATGLKDYLGLHLGFVLGR